MRFAVIAAVVAASAPVHAGGLARLATEVRVRLDQASAAHAPVRVPPVPVSVKWRPVRVGSFELGAPLVALAAANLDDDKAHGELYAITAREVIAFSVANGKATELARVAFAGELAVPAPRDVVGAAAIDGDALVASVSGYTRALRVTWKGGQLIGEPGPIGVPICGKELAKLAPGRNYYLEGGTTPSYAGLCRDVIDREGVPRHVRATLAATNKLAVAIDGGALREYPAVGVAFEIADVDRDGSPEIIVSGAGAPGDEDAVKVMTLPDDKPLVRKAFTGGVVGVAAALDGAGPLAVIAAVRLVGATRVDLWRLD